jgi:membrane-associated phospholipid phosphatase
MSRALHIALGAAFAACIVHAGVVFAQNAPARVTEATDGWLPPTTARTWIAPVHALPPPAPQRTARRPYRLYPALDLAVLVAGGALWVLPEFMQREIVHLGRCPCDPAMLNDLDRSTAGVSIPNTGDAVNVATAVMLVFPFAFDAFDVGRSRGSAYEWVEDTVVIGEALVVGGALQEITKLALQRPRPAAYGIDPNDPRLADPDLYLSFYSLSTAEIFTAATAGAVTHALRHPRSPWRWVYLGAAETLATAFGVTRFVTGKHFPTDVIAAAAVGGLVGLVVPVLHTRLPAVTLGAAVMPGTAMLTATVRTF